MLFEHLQMGMHSGIHIIYATQRLRKHYFEKMFQHLNETIVPSGTTQKYFSASSLDLHYDYRENSISKSISLKLSVRNEITYKVFRKTNIKMYLQIRQFNSQICSAFCLSRPSKGRS